MRGRSTQERFVRGDGTCRVVVGTLAFGLGVNKPDVRAKSIRGLKLLVYEALRY